MAADVYTRSASSRKYSWWSEFTNQTNFNVPATDPTKPSTGDIYGPTSYWLGSEPDVLSTTNFTMQFATEFLAPVEGEYTFTINDGTDASAIYIDDNLSTYCCDIHTLDPEYVGNSTKIISIPSDPEHHAPSKTVYLLPHLIYNIFFFHINLSGDAIFNASVTLPSGEVHDISDYTGNIGEYGGISDCEIFVTSFTGGSYSATTTYDTHDFYTQVCATRVRTFCQEAKQTIFYVMTPTAGITSSSESSTLMEPSSVPITSESSIEVSSSVPSIHVSSSILSVSSISPSSDSSISISSELSSARTFSSSTDSLSSLAYDSTTNPTKVSSTISQSEISSTSGSICSTSIVNSVTSQYPASSELTFTGNRENSANLSVITASTSSKVTSSDSSESYQSATASAISNLSSMSVIESDSIVSSIRDGSAGISTDLTSQRFLNSSSIVETPPKEHSTSIISETISSQRGNNVSVTSSPNQKGDDAKAAFKSSKLSVSTSTYTDESGQTMTITVECPQNSNGSLHKTNEDVLFRTVTQDNHHKTTTGNDQDEVSQKVLTASSVSVEETDGTTKIIANNDRPSSRKDHTTDQLPPSSTLKQQTVLSSSAAVVIEYPASTVHIVEQSPNGASIRISSLMMSLVTLIFSVFIA